MDQARVDSFLDDGWCLIGQLHRWLSKWPIGAHDRNELTELICALQRFWTTSDDLGLLRIARTSLALEQLLERFCAKTLAFTAERLQDVTSGVEALQDLLLGLEATREEPAFSNPDSIVRLERHIRRIDAIEVGVLTKATDVIARPEISVVEETRAIDADLQAGSENVISTVPRIEEPDMVHNSIERSLVVMLAQFVAKLDDTCHRLHARVIADAAPYATTTSRLEHLAQATRELLDQIVRQSGTVGSIGIDGGFDLLVTSTNASDLTQLQSTEKTLTATEPQIFRPQLDRPAGTTLEDDQRFASINVAQTLAEPDRTVAEVKSHRLLLVQESLFYRHLIGIALQAAGYEPIATDKIAEARTILGQSTDFCAVLIAANLSSEIDEVIDECRGRLNIKVIRLTPLGYVQAEATGADAHVSRSHPQQLVAILDRLLNRSSIETRKSA